ncbi:ATP-dependent DNA ligase [Aestuariimicrobium ganziense]|uniref:ATP-dependent DNA ligase n=1 Tax=Aestuariimicrobium ganziense TaxID=2773677 RepID=UPI001943978E|nr:ATP-dependent DNA ligase [Aestuariimicrobium ganziense]
MLLNEVVATSGQVASTRSRKQKIALLAACLTSAHAQGADLEVIASWLAGRLRQRRTGVGWRSVHDLPAPAASPTLTTAQVEDTFAALGAVAGQGSRTSRSGAVEQLFSAATDDEQQWLRGIITGEVRQGALDALVQEALAVATAAPLVTVRRAAMLAGGTPPVAELAFSGGAPALAQVALTPGRPVLPMLASSAPDLATALDRLSPTGHEQVAVDAKLDGIRLQAHKHAGQVVLATRSLDVITDRLPEVVAVVEALPADDLVLDGEALWMDEAGRPRAFQETASRTAQSDGGAVTPFFFDLLHLDGVDLLDRPAHERWAALERLVPERFRVERLVTADPDEAASFQWRVLAEGHEGVVVKDVEAPYDAGRRGSSWIKVKPVHTLDLVVLAVEQGSGRRRGWLSNIHLGARSAATGEFVMVGKTFKGMTDQMLAWQTQRFTELATGPTDGWVVPVRPEQVVEIALDGIQRSTRYPGGVALRFARVVGYRDDKTVDQVDTIEAIREQFWGRASAGDA